MTKKQVKKRFFLNTPGHRHQLFFLVKAIIKLLFQAENAVRVRSTSAME